MKLFLVNRGLTTLDGIDLTGVTHLYCSHNQLTSLPPLPVTLEKLYCWNNQLTSHLTTLKILDCTNNQLTSLPPLPETLKILYCSNNQLTSLPPLPETLEKLYCEGNLIVSLPPLPWGLENMVKEKLDQHNKKCIDLGLQTVDILPDKSLWDEINEMWLDWLYRIGGEKYNETVCALH